ncbi:alpha/beta fold hydrolase [Litoreibacter roseus]|uniref:Hydrolase or acyltransferase (Alpha/beta hydrolase) n=1 Tax=Litoreibacter roseus TaxID=2601869 RepID=A0A6N6JC21_9RHOB|nr:alpha/beta hydrolase [Litoreibacter roseus]GFE63715.1 hydrolase or acyltransferase (alpha/beta hydrolase) [Litoreibacter roseus]
MVRSYLLPGFLITALAACSAAVGSQDTAFSEGERGQILDVNGTQVHAVVEGSGPDLILFHGAGGSHRDFTFSMVDKLKDDFRVVVFDRPGHGLTERIDARAGDGESLAEQADLLHSAAEMLNVSNAIVAGQSFGGALALNYTLRHPDDVAGVVAISAVSNPWPGELDAWYRVNGTWLGQNVLIPIISVFATRNRVEGTLEGVFEPDPVPPGYIDHIGVDLATRPTQLRANVQQINRLLGDVKAQVGQYDQIDVPLEIIHGTADSTVPFDVHADPLSTQVKGARLTVLEGTGHMPHHAEEAQVVEAIRRAAKRAGLL